MGALIRTTYIDTTKVQIKQFPLNSQLLGVRLDGNSVKISYIEDNSQDGVCDIEFRMYLPNDDEIDFDFKSYSFMGVLKLDELEYHVFCKNVNQIVDLR